MLILFLSVSVHGRETNTLSWTELIHLGQSELKSNNWDAAAGNFRAAAAIRPTNSYACFELGYCLAKLHQYKEAITNFDRTVFLDPKYGDAYLWLGICHYYRGAYQRSVDFLQSYVSLNTTNSYAYNQLGKSFKGLQRYDEAIKMFQQAILIEPKYVEAHYGLGDCYYKKRAYQQAVDSLQQCVSLDTTNFHGYCRLGASQFELHRFEEAADSFQKAIQLKPDDFYVNYKRAESLMEIGRFAEATVNSEKAYEINKGDTLTRLQLLSCYLITLQYKNAAKLVPIFFIIGGGLLMLSYGIGLAVLLKFSFMLRPNLFPGLGFSLAWVVIFFEGQLAFIVPLGLFTMINMAQNTLLAMTLSGIPVIVAAVVGFSRQSWGKSFAWPLRLGTGKVILLSLGFWILISLFNSGYVGLLTWITGKPVMQETMPLIKEALAANPLMAILAIVIVGPMVEEILFRGLIYGALQRRLRVTGTILASSLLFALVHLQVIGFIPLFCFGLLLGWCRWKTESVGLSMLIHGLNNGFSVVLVKYFENGS
ncbi:MAG: tetratricopeptide repeat protein [Limisphaerales bacterium]